ncbi:MULTISPECIES: helix-turn-helix domain-containing protein [unclassified Caulobacter]|uniref:helix-turn-helix domain-containing protein n=1 Tax=unclassified Caulobacter TaxID=2648921 RepID=UPI0009E79772|nr:MULTISPECIES: helix-turn-helix transcriptional regulator [unclassified Caulobacter]
MRHRGMDLRGVVGANIQAARSASGALQDDIAHEAGIHPTYLSGIENGKRNITLRVLERLAAALGVTEAELVRRKDR